MLHVMSDERDQTGGPDGRDQLDDAEDPILGEMPEGLDDGLYPKHLEDLKREPAFGEAVLSFPDEHGGYQDVALHDVEATEDADDGSDRTKILLRNGVIVVASGAAIAGAIAAVRYRRRHRAS